MEIEDLPTPLPLACSTCMEPLTWVYVHHIRRNVAVVPLQGPDRFSFRIHTCNLRRERDWRNVQRYPPRALRRGAKRAKAIYEAARAQKLIEKGASDGS
jgi:hypothetical protein